MFRHLAVVLFVAVLSPASQAQKNQAMDPDFAAHVKEWTTRPEFLSPLVDHLPAGGNVPSPRDVLGHDIGAPKQLTYYADVLRYYDTLAAHSPRVRVIRIGKTEEGRELAIVFVGSEDSIAHLDQTRENLARIADPRGLSETAGTDRAYEADLYAFRRAAQRRAGAAGDADGTDLPPGDGRLVADREHPGPRYCGNFAGCRSRWARPLD